MLKMRAKLNYHTASPYMYLYTTVISARHCTIDSNDDVSSFIAQFVQVYQRTYMLRKLSSWPSRYGVNLLYDYLFMWQKVTFVVIVTYEVLKL